MAKRKTARKTSVKRSSTKKASGAKRGKRTTAPRGLNLKKIRADLLLAIAAMKKSSGAALGERAAPDSDQAQLQQMVDRINVYCEEENRCGDFMIVPL